MNAHKNMKMLSLLMIVAILLSMIAACGTTETQTATEPVKETIKEVVVTKEVVVEKVVPATRTDIRIMMAIPINAEIVMEDILDRFESQNPDINVILDVVPYQAILDILPLQLETGEGPDIAKVSDISGLTDYYLDMRPYLSDPAYWEKNMGLTIQHMNPDGGNKISGYYTDVTFTAPFINRTLFEQAGVPVPSDTSDKVTWEQWAEAARKVKEATGVDYAMAMDRSGHRFAGPAISQGAKFFDETGKPKIDDAGFRTMAQLMLDWHKDGIMPLDVWAGGGSYREPTPEFINGKLVFFMSGVWQVGAFNDKIGDKFDWEVVPNPCGPTICSGMPGGSVMAAMKATKHPQEVARVMEFLAAEENYREWAERALYLPQHNGIMAKGLEFKTNLPQTQEAFKAFGAEAARAVPLGWTLQNYKNRTLVFNAIRDRLTQAIVGELTLDEAIARMQSDIDEGLAKTK